MKLEKKLNYPYKFSYHLIIEFLNSLKIFFVIILSLIFLTNFVEELLFLKENNIVKSLYLRTFFFTSLKSPSLILEMFPFIFLFSGIHFFIKLIRSNEYISLKISGLSNLYIIMIPAFFSFFLSSFLVLFFTPFSSEMVKIYEQEKKIITDDQNLIILNENGIWLKEKSNKNELIIMHAENFFVKKKKYDLQKLKIYKHDLSGQLSETIISDNGEVREDKIILYNVLMYKGSDNKKKFYKKIDLKTNIIFSELTGLFSNTNTFSIWNINQHIQILKKNGYLGDELIVKFNKYLSFPFLVFSTIVFSTVFTININRRFDNYTYSFFGIISGIGIYFLIDLSIAFGQSDRIPLTLSVWAPIILILILSTISLIRSNEN